MFLKTMDIAIGFVLFNPSKSKRLIMNYLYVRNLLKDFPVFTLELAFNDDPHELQESDTVFHVRSKSYMFHKERMCRVLETKIPSQYTKLVFMDADLYFSSQDWYSKMSQKLEEFDAVQGFEIANWMTLDYKKTIFRRRPIFFDSGEFTTFRYHPGFIWGFRREWYTKIGFFDWAVSGGGDILYGVAWKDQQLRKPLHSSTSSILPAFEEFRTLEKPRLSYLEGIQVYHLFHGCRINRQYSERHQILNKVEDIRTILTLNDYGIYEWIEPEKYNPLFLKYFTSRDDDCIKQDQNLDSFGQKLY